MREQCNMLSDYCLADNTVLCRVDRRAGYTVDVTFNYTSFLQVIVSETDSELPGDEPSPCANLACIASCCMAAK
jgi:hypothetical protein